MRTSTDFSSTDLRVFQQQRLLWRKAQSCRVRLPLLLWDAVAQLARQHGLSKVARLLRLDFTRLRLHMEHPQPMTQPQPEAKSKTKVLVAHEAPSFVEVKWSPPAQPAHEPSGWAELRDGSGQVLRKMPFARSFHECGEGGMLMVQQCRDAGLPDPFWESDP